MAPENKVLELVRNLIARAEHVNTPAPEAELCYKQANKLMTKHAIDEAMLEATMSVADRHRPDKIEIPVGYASAGEFFSKMRSLLYQIAETNRCKAVPAERDYSIVEIYGFAEDTRWTEMLFTTMLMDFLGKVNPKWDRSLPIEQNIYNFKVAGYKWAKIDEISMQNGNESMQRMKMEKRWTGYNIETGIASYEEALAGTGFYNKMHSIYTKYAKSIGDDQLVKTTSFDQYREQFTLAFTERMTIRLMEMRGENEEEVKAAGAELALIDRSHLIDEAIWDNHPDMHPDEVARQNALWREKQQQIAERREAKLAAMTKGERSKFLEQEERDRRKAMRASRGKVRYVAYQTAASSRGAAAADSVDLSRKRHTAGRGEQGSLS